MKPPTNMRKSIFNYIVSTFGLDPKDIMDDDIMAVYDAASEKVVGKVSERLKNKINALVPDHDPATLYEALEVMPTATQDEIKAAFRIAAKRFHPDANKDPQAAKFFDFAVQANKILSDPKSRRRYDIAMRLMATENEDVEDNGFVKVVRNSRGTAASSGGSGGSGGSSFSSVANARGTKTQNTPPPAPMVGVTTLAPLVPGLLDASLLNQPIDESNPVRILYADYTTLTTHPSTGKSFKTIKFSLAVFHPSYVTPNQEVGIMSNGDLILPYDPVGMPVSLAGKVIATGRIFTMSMQNNGKFGRRGYTQEDYEIHI